MRESPRSMILWSRSVIAWRKDSSFASAHSSSRVSVSVAHIDATLFASLQTDAMKKNRPREAFTAPSQTATLRAARQTATVLHLSPSPARLGMTNRDAQREFVALGIVCARQRRARPCPQRRAHAKEMSTPANLQAGAFQSSEPVEIKPSNQALQTTSVTRSGFGKVPVSDRQRRGV